MSVDRGIIVAPVTIDDVKQVLGESTNDLAALCRSSNINMMSKYKPVSLAETFVTNSLNADKRTWTAKSGAGWWIGNPNIGDGVFGMRIVNDVQQAKELGRWTYNKPTGTSEAPYRLSDFIGYNSNENENNFPLRAVVYGYNSEKNVVYDDNVVCILFQGGDDPVYPNNTFSLGDLLNMLRKGLGDNIYPAICIYNETKGWKTFVSSDVPMKPGVMNDEITIFRVDFKHKGKIYEGEILKDNYRGYLTDYKVGDRLTFIPLLCSTTGHDPTTFPQCIVCPAVKNTVEFCDAYVTLPLADSGNKPVTTKTIVVNISNLKLRQEVGQMLYYNNSDNTAGVIKSETLLKVSFTLSTDYLTNLRIRLVGESDDGEGTYLKTDDVSIGINDVINFAINEKSFKMKSYGSLSDAQKGVNADYSFGIPTQIAYAEHENTKCPDWTVRIELEADKATGPDSNTRYEFKFDGGGVSADGVILNEKY